MKEIKNIAFALFALLLSLFIGRMVYAKNTAIPAESAGLALDVNHWYWGPYNARSWHNMREIFPSARVAAGADIYPLHRVRAEKAKISLTTKIEDVSSKKSVEIQQLLKSTYADGFLVLDHGEVALEWYGDSYDGIKPHLVMSISKSILGALVGTLIDEYKIDLNKPVTFWLPELKGTNFDGATLRNAIDMEVSDNTQGPTPDYDASDEAVGWLPPRRGSYPNLRSWLASLNRPHSEHGYRFLYLDQSTNVAAWALERITGKKLAELVSEKLWKPLGAEQDGYYVLDRAQDEYASAGFNATLRDIGRFGAMIASKGFYNGSQIVPSAWIEDIRNGENSAAWKRGSDAIGTGPGHVDGSYRAFWWVTSKTCGRMTGIGLGNQLLVIDPEADIVVALFSVTPDPELLDGNHTVQYNAIDQIISKLSKKPRCFEG